MDKQKYYDLLKNNKYIQHFAAMLLQYEAGKTEGGSVNFGSFNETSGNSTAFGAGQFITETRNTVLEKYGLDAWKPDIEEQLAASVALLEHTGMLEEVSKGNYKPLAGKKGAWETFKPGQPGHEPLKIHDANTGSVELNELTSSENLEGFKIYAEYDPAYSLSNMDAEMYQSKMNLFDVDTVFPLDNVANLYPEYDDAIINAGSVQRGLKDKLAESKEVKADTEEAEEVPTVEEDGLVIPDISGFSQAKKDVFNKIKEIVVKNKLPYSSEILEKYYTDIKSADFGALQKIEEKAFENVPIEGRKFEVNASIDILKSILDDENASYGDKARAKDLLEETSNLKESDLYNKVKRQTTPTSSPYLKQTYTPGAKTGEIQKKKKLNKLLSDIQGFSGRLEYLNTKVEEPVESVESVEPEVEERPKESVVSLPVKEDVLDALKGLKGSDTTKGLKGGRKDIGASPTPEPLKFGEEAFLKLKAFAEGQYEKIKENPESALNALQAGAGLISLYSAVKKDKVNKTKVSPLMLEAVNKAKKIMDEGMPYEEKMAAIKDMNNAYTGAMKNVMAISGGQRGMALSNIGGVDAARVSGLVDLAGKSASMRMDGMKLYQNAVGDYTKSKLTADMSNEQMRVKLNEGRKERLYKVGNNLYEQAMEFNRNFKDQENNEDLLNALADVQNQSNPNNESSSLALENFAKRFENFDITPRNNEVKKD